MFKKLLKRKLLRDCKGFTLIELLVVISIIALLSTVVLASLKTARDKAKAQAVVSTMLQIKNAAELYKTSTGLDAGDIFELIPTYLSATPTDPFGVEGFFDLKYEESSYKWCGGKVPDASEAENGKLYIVYYETFEPIPRGLFSKYRQNSIGVVYDGTNGYDLSTCVE